MSGNNTVVVAMSGGVDSSVAAGLLINSGFEVIGITMCFNLPDPCDGRPMCCGASAIEDAQRVAAQLGIKHYTLGFGDELKSKVIDNFFQEYAAGRTPNPCVRCNELLKFDSLLKKSLALGADYLATGHYARKVNIPPYFLAKGADRDKDQTYFLYRMRQEQLGKVLFPLGGFTKAEVREMAQQMELPVADKPDSQEICFISGREQLDEMRRQASPDSGPGPILDTSGKVIGTHAGISLYTVGQRRGMGIAAPHPLYVISINVAENSITAGPVEETSSSRLTASDLVFPDTAFSAPLKLNVKIRNVHKEAPAMVTVLGDVAEVVFDEPQFAVTPGQSAVFYEGNIVVGGGIIN